MNMGIAINNTKDFTRPYTPRDPATCNCTGKGTLCKEVQRQTDKFGDAVELAANKKELNIALPKIFTY